MSNADRDRWLREQRKRQRSVPRDQVLSAVKKILATRDGDSSDLILSLLGEMSPNQRTRLKDVIDEALWCELCWGDKPCYCAPCFDE